MPTPDLDAQRCLESDGRILLSSGVLFDPLRPDKSLIEIRDIAHGLSHLCRYAGHCPVFYSVAQHSVRVSRRFVDPIDRLVGLLHDASEGLGLVDIPSPVKARIPGYKEAEKRLMEAVAWRFGLEPEMFEHPSLKMADQAEYLHERANFWAARLSPTFPLFNPWSPDVAYAEFMREFQSINDEID